MAARWEDEEFDQPTPRVTLRTLTEAQDAITERGKAYGHPLENHSATAEMWSSYLQRRYGVSLPLDAEDVCLLNILQKVSREAHQRKHDNRVDMAGFAANIEMAQQERERRDSTSAKTDTRD